MNQVEKGDRHVRVITALKDADIQTVHHAVHIHVVAAVVDATDIGQVNVVFFQVIFDHSQRGNPRLAEAPRRRVDRPHLVFRIVDQAVPVQVARQKGGAGNLPRGGGTGSEGQFVFPVRNIEKEKPGFGRVVGAGPDQNIARDVDARRRVLNPDHPRIGAPLRIRRDQQADHRAAPIGDPDVEPDLRLTRKADRGALFGEKPPVVRDGGQEEPVFKGFQRETLSLKRTAAAGLIVLIPVSKDIPHCSLLLSGNKCRIESQ